MELERLIHQKMQQLNGLDLVIAQYILEYPERVENLSIVELAEEVHASKSSVLRFTKKLGFSGYSEFKYFLKHEAKAAAQKIDSQNVHALQMADILQTIKLLEGQDFLPIYRLFDESKTIYCYATGFSQKKALEEFSKLMLTLGKRVLLIPNKTELDIAMPMITRDDCVVISSVSGETEDIKLNLTSFQTRKIPVLSLTATQDNYFARHSTYHLPYQCTSFNVGRKSKDVISVITLHLLIDYLYRSYGRYQRLTGNK